MAKRKSSTLAQRRAAHQEYQQAKKKPLGAGARFAAVEKSAALGGAKEAGAVAAAVMWKKYGKKGGAKLIAKGKKANKNLARE